jgi:hypothetical protein
MLCCAWHGGMVALCVVTTISGSHLGFFMSVFSCRVFHLDLSMSNLSKAPNLRSIGVESKRVLYKYLWQGRPH